jgi:peptidoglycan hydrolase-like protein with peptidoglycan-binding domain
MRKSIIVVGIATLLIPTSSFAQDIGTQGGYCPQISQNLHRGMRDADTTPPGQVSELQKFLVDYYDLNPDTYVTGYFGRLTQQNVIQFQIDQNITPASGYVGPLTRAAIQRVCGRTAGGVPNPPIACDHPAPPQGCYWQHGAMCAQDQLICPTGNAAPTCTLAATPSTIQVGQSSTLSWTSTNATQGYISTIGTVAANGSQSISPTQTTTYNGTFWGPGGSAQCFATLTLTPALITTCQRPAPPPGCHWVPGGTNNCADDNLVCDTQGQSTLVGTPSSGPAPLSVTFSGSAPGTGYQLDYGDGSSPALKQQACGPGPCTSVAASATHSYTAAGTYTAKLIIKAVP